MNVEAWLDAIRKAQLEGENPDGVTSREMSKMWKCNQSTTTTRIKTLVDMGVLKYNGKRIESGVAGQKTMVPVYAPTQQD